MSRNRFGIPPMSAMRLQALARTDPDTHAGHPTRDHQVIVGKKGLEDRLDGLAASQALVAGHTSEMLALIGAGVENKVLIVETRTIGAEGWLTRKWQAPFASLAVINPSASTITVTEGSAGGTAAQGDGPGSFIVPPGSFVCMPLVGRSVTFTGAAGSRFSYTAMADRAAPSGGGTLGSSSATLPTVVRLEDGAGAALATVAAFHNADNQQPGPAANGILTGGIAQLLTAIGNLDRQRETGLDGIPAAGIATGVASFAQSIATTTTGVIGAGAITAVITPASMNGIQAGAVVQIDAAGLREPAVVIAAPGPTATICFTAVTGARFAHGGTYALTTFVYNQERDAVGEQDGASGTGTAVAAEYEWNGGGPPLASGLAAGLQFDRARSLQAKGLGAGAITATAAGNPSIVFTGGAAATNTIQPGQSLQLLNAGVAVETVYVAQSWLPGSSATVPLQTLVVNAGSTSAQWDRYAFNGPGLNGFTPVGVGIEEEALFDPVSGLFYIERAATQDGVSGQNIVLESVALFNGATFDRWRGTAGAANVTQVAATTGAQNNLWNAAAVLAAGVSAIIPTYSARTFMILGNTSAATTITVQVSADGIVFRNSSVTVAANGDFTIDCRPLFGTFYVRLLSSAAANISASLTGVN